MNLKDLCRNLDDQFKIDILPPDMPFSVLMPKVYSGANIDMYRYLEKKFLEKFHGLMINNGENIGKVYLGVFFSNEILEEIFSRNANNAMIFFHHPLDLESCGRGFLPINEEYFDRLRENNLSVYVLHTPLDINREISTSRSISSAIGLINIIEYCPDSIGFAGICGDMPESIDFAEFLDLLKKIFDIKQINFIRKNEKAKRIGVIAGGGTSVSYIQEAIGLGCDTYLTGDFINKIENEFGKKQKKEFEEAKNGLPINLIECSHYATEELVLRKELADFFSKIGILTELIKQNNPWK